MKISVLLFAAAREIAGCESLAVEVSGITTNDAPTIGDLRAGLLHAEPRLAGISRSLLWAVNNEYANDSRLVSESDSVACFPPVSGG